MNSLTPKIRTIVASMALLCCLPALSQNPNGLVMPSVDPLGDSLAISRVRARMDSIRQYRPTVAVVLAGGGARGMAHLGVLRYMEEQGIPVDLIGGTSMGGLVAGLYSLGYDAPYLDSLVRGFDWPVMMSDRVEDSFQSYGRRKMAERFALTIPFRYGKDDAREKIARQSIIGNNISEIETASTEIMSESLSKLGVGLPDGFLFGYNVRNTLSSVSVGYQDSLQFDTLPIPFFCVAADMYTMSEKNWTEGNLADALRSTMAIPIYFRPVRTEGMVLLDGGVRNNFPVDVARAMGADIIIGSDMPSDKNFSDLESLYGLVMQTIGMLSNDALSKNKDGADLLVSHPLEGYSLLSFDSESIDDIIRQGYENAVSREEDFRRIAELTGGKTVAKEYRRAVDLGKEKVRVGEVRIVGVSPEEQALLLGSRLIPNEGYFGKEEIESTLSVLYGSKAFESVTYSLSGKEEPYTLIFDCRKGQRNEFGAGAHFDTDEIVYVDAFLGVGTRRLFGPRLLTEMKIGKNSYLGVEASYKPITRTPIVGVALRASQKNFRYSYGKDYAMYSALHSGLDLFIEDASLVFGHARIGLSAEMEPYEDYIDAEMSWKGTDFESHWFSAFADICLDTFNDGYFPTSGVKIGVLARETFAGYSVYLEDRNGYVGEGKVKPYFNGLLSAQGAFSDGNLTLLPSLYLGWTSADSGMKYFAHVLSAGGILGGRYVECQIPFFGISSGMDVYDGILFSAQFDMRYRLSHKNYLSLKSQILQNADTVKGMFSHDPTAYAFGAEFGRKTMAGPFKVGGFWSNNTGFGLNLSFGFDF